MSQFRDDEIAAWFRPLAYAYVSDPLIMTLDCRTFIVTATDEVQNRFGSALVRCAAGARQSLFGQNGVEFARDLITKTLAAGALLPGNGLSPQLRLLVQHCTSVSQLRELMVTPLPSSRTLFLEVVRQADKVQLKVAIRPVVKVYTTEIGIVEEPMIRTGCVMRLLRYSGNQPDEILRLAEIARVLQCGISELVTVQRRGEIPNLVRPQIARSRNAIRVFTIGNQPVTGDSFDVLAASALQDGFHTIKTPTVGERKTRIPSALSPAKVIWNLNHITDRGMNLMFHALTGGDVRTPIRYSSTSMWGNTAELLQLYIACLRTGLPGVLDIETRAYNTGDYCAKVLFPSLQLLGGFRSNGHVPMNVAAYEISPFEFYPLFGVPWPRMEAKDGYTLADFIVAVHQQLVREFNQLLGVSVNVTVTKSEHLYSAIEHALKLGEIVEVIRQWSSEDRVLFNYYDQNGIAQLRISDVVLLENENNSIAEVLNLHKAWPGGALGYVYDAAMAHAGPVYHNPKDSRLGKVAEIANLHFPSVGKANYGMNIISQVVRLYPQGGGRGGDNIDPLVFLLLLERSDALVNLVQDCVKRWIFPLQKEQSGMIGLYEIGLGGRWTFDRFWEVQGSRRPAAFAW